MKFVERFIYKIRNFFWNYPDVLFFNKKSFGSSVFKTYLDLRPFSHLAFSVAILAVISLFFISNPNRLVRAETSTLIEGVIIGVDENGEKSSIQKVNPLVLTNIQIEKDINELVYESLVKVRVDGEKENILAELIIPNESGDNYRVKLREDVYWHDGDQFTAKDVIATFNLLELLDNESSTKTIFSTVANKRVKLIPVEGDDFRFEFQLEGAIPNFYELISFKILPAKYLDELNTNNILTSEPFINKNPVGTGKYKLVTGDSGKVVLEKNSQYYSSEKIPGIDRIQFQLYSSEESLKTALTTGQVHSVAGLTSNSLTDLDTDSKINILKTDVIYTQYYSMYFNLGENGPSIFKNKKIRQAISASINREYIVDVLEGEAEEAFGPIGKNSFAFAQDIKRYTFDSEFAKKTMDEEGWVLNSETGLREKDGEILEFELIAIDNVDRNKVTDSIVEDLSDMGIKVNLVRKENREVINENILNRSFDALVYSMTTFIDPDRFELFHSSQIQHPGLNISSFASEEKTVAIEENADGKVERVELPEVDLRLNRGRSFIEEEARSKEYFDFQRIVAEEAPAVFLYHPKLNYAVSKRVKNVDISNANTLEERFSTINDWYIEL
ncbi:MAG TPA: ABC transporter substrate-binding protein [Candidatus Dojkabacteria bacterium]|jgi:peptide/nickel transport system substrate-binding protein